LTFSSDLRNENLSFASLYQEVNEDLGKTYQIHSRASIEVIGSQTNGVAYSLQFLSLMRQVLGECDLKTYHGKEFLRLCEVLAEQLGDKNKQIRRLIISLMLSVL